MFILPFKTELTWLEKRTILYTVHGSWAYGTNVRGSDEDFKGICVPPPVYRNGYSRAFEQVTCSLPDIVIYEIRKFFSLGAKCNPNILECLWVPPDLILKETIAGTVLRVHRDKFLSSLAFKSFSGYAVSQLNSLKKVPAEGSPRALAYGKCGYDAKFGMHLVRLLRMLGEILKDGELIVRRHDADVLLDIRKGNWSEARLIAEVLRLETENKKLSKTTSLPENPDRDFLDSLCMEIIRVTDVTSALEKFDVL